MRWLSVGQEANGVIAIGQMATGVVALGQFATGVVAVGQVARGFIAIGQVSIGVFAVGMGSVGLVYSVGMVGAGGRGLGLILPLVPSFGASRSGPRTVAPARLFAGAASDGWVDTTVAQDKLGPVLISGGTPLDVRFDSRLRRALDLQAGASAQSGAPAVTAHLTRTSDGWVCDQLQHVPVRRWRVPGWWLWWGVQLTTLAVASVTFWLLAGIPMVQALFNPGGILVSR